MLRFYPLLGIFLGFWCLAPESKAEPLDGPKSDERGNIVLYDKDQVLRSRIGLLDSTFFTGNVGIGTTSPRYKLELYDDSTERDYAAVMAHHLKTKVDAVAYGTGLIGKGIDAPAKGVTNGGYVQGVNAVAFLAGAGTIDTIFGLGSVIGTTATGTGTVNNAYAVWAEVKNPGNGKIVKGYGVHVPDVKALKGYGIHQDGKDDLNYFAGKVGVGIETPTARLHVNGDANIGNWSSENLEDNGFAKIGSVLFQWGHHQPNDPNKTIHFPVEFSSVFNVQCTPKGDQVCAVKSLGKKSFGVTEKSAQSGFYWFATGR